MKITKRSGNIVIYDDEKIVQSIMKANAETTEEFSPKAAAYLADAVLGKLVREHDIITTQMLREGVNSALIERGLPMTAERYMSYGKDQ